MSTSVLPYAHSHHRLRDRIYHFVHRHRGGQTTRALTEHTKFNDSILNRLPIELVRMIAEYLHPADTAALALGNKQMSNCLDSPWSLPVTGDRLELLSRLEKDRADPHRFVCIPCAKLHVRIPKLEKIRLGDTTRICPYAEVLVGFPLTLEWTLIQLIMRRHNMSSSRHGPSLKVLNLLSKSSDGAPRWHMETTSAIVQDKLLVRTIYEKQLYKPDYYKKPLRDILPAGQAIDPGVAACKHISRSVMTGMVSCALSHVKRVMVSVGIVSELGHERINQLEYKSIDTCNYCQVPRRCLQCPTEFLVSIADGLKCKLRICKFVDLGRGETPLCREWMALNEPAVAVPPQSKPFDMLGEQDIFRRFRGGSWLLRHDKEIMQPMVEARYDGVIPVQY